MHGSPVRPVDKYLVDGSAVIATNGGNHKMCNRLRREST